MAELSNSASIHVSLTGRCMLCRFQRLAQIFPSSCVAPNTIQILQAYLYIPSIICGFEQPATTERQTQHCVHQPLSLRTTCRALVGLFVRLEQPK